MRRTASLELCDYNITCFKQVAYDNDSQFISCMFVYLTINNNYKQAIQA